ncbi:sensor histidine kinase [Sansalvadorimonas verongulae]|uniref:sensor histidine kinase n=1 Tax=Sansalvadorimonas verongulae TaxID=2172824 RepID=UPI0012BD4ABF|nr:ATP-binding protein [Sansalvadorimonas verongulae]MTI13462.1 hypothetical protein [Sansalvadorimonas verongulae]
MPPEPMSADRVYNLYNSYRFLLAVSLFLVILIPESPLFFGSVSTRYAVAYCGVYLLQFVVTFLLFRSRPSTTAVFGIAFLDISLICLLLLLGRQQDNGLTTLLFVPIIIGNILIPGRIGVLLAAMASIFLMFISYYTDSIGLFSQHIDVGLKGTLFFVTALLMQSYNQRLKNTEKTAQLSQSRAIDLQKLSQRIMQHMRTGIVVIREPDQVVMMNDAAHLMLATQTDEGDLDTISHQLQIAYWQWKENPNLRQNSFRATPDTPDVQPNFTRLAYEADVYVLVFLEDKATMSQQAQQLKLAALGQLTASIAHEIRNPLGAISHSAQLLSESENLDKHDQKLLNIVHKHSRRMNDIIETILQLSRKEQWSPELLDVNDWLNQFIREEHFSGFDRPKIQFKPTRKELLARFDTKQLHQVIMNIFLNGLRYSMQKTGTASLMIKTGVNTSGHPWLEIIDQGPGIPVHQAGSVFDPFFTTDKSGTGLGLYISRELCEANQASLELLSTKNDGGCTFRISFAHPGKRIE